MPRRRDPSDKFAHDGSGFVSEEEANRIAAQVPAILRETPRASRRITKDLEGDEGGGEVWPLAGPITDDEDMPLFVEWELADGQQALFKAAFNEALEATQLYAEDAPDALRRAASLAYNTIGVTDDMLFKWMDEYESEGFAGDDPATSDLGDEEDEEEMSPFLQNEYGLALSKSADELRYTFSVVYKASKDGDLHTDAHNEFASADELRKAQHEYVKGGDRSIFLQHQLSEHGMRKAGEWVDIVSWPFEVEADLFLPMTKDTGTTLQKKSVKIPGESVWMGVVWEPWAWEMVKSGAIRGFSLGGRTERKLISI